MKKTIIRQRTSPRFIGTLLTFATCGIVVSNAQITIYPYDVVLAGKVLYQATDTVKSLTVGAINPGPSGANKTWDFSTLLSNTIDTMTFTNPAWLSSGSNFPTSNLAILFPDGTEYYLKNTATGLFIMGAYADFTGQGSGVLQMNPNEEITSFPNTYNSTFQNTSGFTLTAPYSSFPIDSVRIKEEKDKNVLTDAWGSITTPLGTYNCLRQKGKVVTHDSIWIRNSITSQWSFAAETLDSNWHFAWWASGLGFSVLEFDSTAGDTIQSITWLKTLPVIGGLAENPSLSAVKAYPNPSAGKVNIIMPASVKEYTAEIYLATGEKLSSLALPGKDGSLDFSCLPNGIYFLRINSKEGTITRKIVLNR
ncbi:MAG: T9SS type A sorting domain-containing protein [Bacteroidetes bacterium]|nr:MAG: T9SS type A sorting domain-containing protein [Bacteroidota bacterium]